MKKMRFLTVVSAVGLLASAYMTPLMAFSFGIGGSFGGAHFEAAGTESFTADANDTAGRTKTRNKDFQAAMASAYAQVIVGESYFGDGNGFALGYERNFGEANVQEEMEHGQSGSESNASARTNIISTVGATEQGTQRAEGVLKNLSTIFVETPGFTPLGIYLKAGWSTMDVITKEDLYTGGTFGDGSADGEMWGFGFKKSAGGFQVKTEFNYTDWDSLTFTNGGTDAGSTSVKVSPEQWSGKLTIGYNFYVNLIQN